MADQEEEHPLPVTPTLAEESEAPREEEGIEPTPEAVEKATEAAVEAAEALPPSTTEAPLSAEPEVEEAVEGATAVVPTEEPTEQAAVVQATEPASVPATDGGEEATPPIELSTPATATAPEAPAIVVGSQPRPSLSSTKSPTTPSFTRPRSSTTASSATIPGSSHLSAVLVISSIETILASKEAKRSQPLADAATTALALLRGERPFEAGTEAEVVFEPLRLACETRSQPLMVTALDCIGKLVSYSFFSHSSAASPAASRRATLSRPPPPVATASGSIPTAADAAAPTDPKSEPPEPPNPAGNERSPATLETPSRERPPSPVADGGSKSEVALADAVTATICDCFVDATCPDSVQLQIVKALLALILAPATTGSLQVHQSALLRAVRTVYNIFLLSKSVTNQAVAQGALTQIVAHVFGRVERGEAALAALAAREAARRSASGASGAEPAASGEDVDATEPSAAVASASPEMVDKEDGDEAERARDKPVNGSATTEADAEPDKPRERQITLELFERRNSFDGVSEREADGAFMTTQDYHVKDAFLVFRALCKLSMKPVGAESERDLKSHAMRSKLLSLHLILSILNTNLPMFADPAIIIYSASSRERTPFIHAIKQYLCLSLSRNAVSSVLSVFELSCEIFWKVLSGMRTKLKKEIEVLLTEIFLPILEMRNATVKQKSILLTALGRVFHDPQALVELYLNYDCDRTSLDNLYERFMNIISKLATTQFTTSTTTSSASELVGAASLPTVPGGGTFTPSLNTSSMSQGLADSSLYSHQSVEGQLKRQSLECLIAALKSLVLWAGKGAFVATATTNGATSPLRASESATSLPDAAAAASESVETLHIPPQLGAGGSGLNGASSGTSTPTREQADDPGRFENAKHQKTTLLEGIRQFNFKPKRGIKFLIHHGFIKSSAPRDVARFLLHADGLNKTMIGEYLGEGDPENIETMHAFIDFMEFTKMKFTDAMRNLLQAFRLPGEAQKIDRFMLKFAERYFQGNPGVLANAETAYVLAFSIIMLNTDAHSPQIKNRMTKPQFIQNNRGINQGENLPEDYLSELYDEIVSNEIRMKDEVEASLGNQPTASGLSAVGRDLQKEAYVLQAGGMANKTEALFRTLIRGQKRGGATRGAEQFFEASHFEHVRPMFEVVWMPILAGISDPLQNSDHIEIIKLSLTGFKQAIKVVCLFDLELERNAFVTTLAKFTFLNNLGEMRTKNVEAIKALLDVAMVDGNYLKSSWKDVLACVSQLERFQLISQGVDARSVPALGQRQASPVKTRAAQKSQKAKVRKPSEEVMGAAAATHITYAADMIFSASAHLSGDAIVDFVQALSDVSWEEIQSSGLSGSPRTFCLQKLVEISYYNMGRIRLEWSHMWAILGGHFNQVCCHSNANVSFFALDSLRQLAMRFLEKEELANFKFQKDFLRPFEYTMVHNNNTEARDMVLQCLNQMIAARVANLRSGWRTMFGVFSAAAKVMTERVATQAFDIVQRINKDHFSRIVAYGSFADLTVCVTDFCKIAKYQKISLHAIEMLKGVVPAMLACPDCPLSHAAPGRPASDTIPADDPMIKYWFPVLFGYYDVIMNGEDLEVRKRALDYLFETLKKHGDAFPPDFWDSITKEVLFPIFAVLRSRNDVSRFSTHEDMSVWLSTTMIQALRNLVDLYTFYFDTLGRMLDRLLDLLSECICQENDTLARIGTSCLQQLLEKNVRKLDPERWERVISTFIDLYRRTTAYQLFDDNLRMPTEGDLSTDALTSPTRELSDPRFVAPTPLSPMPDPEVDRSLAARQPMRYSDRKRVFRQIIVKCVLQLLLIETTNELLSNTEVYERIPPAELLRLLGVVDDSYRFAKKFNADKDLRMGLWKVGFMKQLPNLLKQESNSAVTLVQVLLRMYNDKRPDHLAKRSETVQAFVPLGVDVVSGFVSLDPDAQARNVAAWTPVVTEVLQGFSSFEKATFLEHLPSFYPLLVDALGRDLSPDIRNSLHACFYRVGDYALNLQTAASPAMSS